MLIREPLGIYVRPIKYKIPDTLFLVYNTSIKIF